MYTLYWGPRTSAIAPDAVLSEAGIGFTRKIVNRTGGRVDDPAFEKISPMKQIPALVSPDGTVLCESVAICLALAEWHPEAQMLPPSASNARAKVYRWLMHIVCNIYECDLRYSYADRYTSDPAGIEGVRQAAAERWDRAFELIEAEAGDGPWFLGKDYSLLDIYLAATVCWHYDTPALLARSPNIARVCANVRKREKTGPLFAIYEMPELDGLV
ncbi:MAG: glutathione S-transferase family protein [Rhodospirillales bacterium]